MRTTLCAQRLRTAVQLAASSLDAEQLAYCISSVQYHLAPRTPLRSAAAAALCMSAVTRDMLSIVHSSTFDVRYSLHFINFSSLRCAAEIAYSPALSTLAHALSLRDCLDCKRVYQRGMFWTSEERCALFRRGVYSCTHCQHYCLQNCNQRWLYAVRMLL
jgi:hypothetical protein